MIFHEGEIMYSYDEREMKKANKDEALFLSFKNLDRSLFIHNEYKMHAGINRPLPIGYDQTISQPSLVYEMTRSLDVDINHTVLEIGTGSGYQTALIAKFAKMVYTVERISELSLSAQKTLAGLGIKNIKFLIGDGSLGWPEYAPYDRIMITAAAADLPMLLVDQLKPNGRMLVPVGMPGYQVLTLVTKDQDGVIDQEALSEVAFVEFKGQYGWD
jgi:protein-L-isoaspartate(D-aspartate) O-methyltransferase